MTEPSKPKIRTTIYIEPNIYIEYKAICKREGDKISQKVERHMARYVAVHKRGNPQLRLDPFIGEYALRNVCFGCDGRFPALHKVEFISGLVANVCNDCLKSYQAKTTVKKVLGIVT